MKWFIYKEFKTKLRPCTPTASGMKSVASPRIVINTNQPTKTSPERVHRLIFAFINECGGGQGCVRGNAIEFDIQRVRDRQSERVQFTCHLCQMGAPTLRNRFSLFLRDLQFYPQRHWRYHTAVALTTT